MSEAAEVTDSPLIICDANIFYSIVTTDLILSLGVAELCRPRWTQHIHHEWMRNLLANRPDLDPARIARRRQQMDAAIDDCLIRDIRCEGRHVGVRPGQHGGNTGRLFRDCPGESANVNDRRGNPTGYVDVLPVLHGEVVIPQAVARELRDPRTLERVRQWIGAPPAWCAIQRPQGPSDPALADLGDGEREAILL